MKWLLSTALFGPLAFASAVVVAQPKPDAEPAQDEKVTCENAYEQAQRDQNAGKLLEAKVGFSRCSTATCPAVVSGQCAAALPDLEHSIPTVVFDARDPNGQQIPATHVFVDDKPLADHIDGLAVPLDPGSHKVRFEAAGFDPASLDIVVLQGQRSQAVVGHFVPKAIAPTPVVRSERPFGVAPWIVSGGGLAVAAVGIGLLVSGQNDISKAKDACPNHHCTTQALVDLGNGGDTKSIAGKALLISGSAILTGGLIWQFAANRSRPVPGVAFTFGPGGGFLGASGTF
jgi:hypothetical protein